MQESALFELVEIDSFAYSIVVVWWVLPVGLVMYVFRRATARFLRERAKNWKWAVLRWAVPCLTFCVAGILAFYRPIPEGVTSLMDLPGLLAAGIAWYLLSTFDVPRPILLSSAWVAHWLGWYAVIVWIESIATKPISLRDEIDRA